MDISFLWTCPTRAGVKSSNRRIGRRLARFDPPPPHFPATRQREPSAPPPHFPATRQRQPARRSDSTTVGTAIKNCTRPLVALARSRSLIQNFKMEITTRTRNIQTEPERRGLNTLYLMGMRAIRRVDDITHIRRVARRRRRVHQTPRDPR